MNISPQEAFALLEDWKKDRISLRVHLSGSTEPINSTIHEIEGNIVRLSSGPENLQLDLQGADFNGDARVGHAGRGAYLVCELRNSHRYSFYVQGT